MKKLKIPKEEKGYGFCGVWDDGKIGWNIPNHLVPNKTRRRTVEKPYEREFYFNDNDRLYLCEIIIRPLKDKNGRPITRLAKKLVKQGG